MSENVTSSKNTIKVTGSIDLTKSIDTLLDKYINKKGDSSLESFFNKELREKIISPLFDNIEKSIKSVQNIKVTSDIDLTKNINHLITESFKDKKLNLSFDSLSNFDISKKLNQIFDSLNFQDIKNDFDTFKANFKEELSGKLDTEKTTQKISFKDAFKGELSKTFDIKFNNNHSKEDRPEEFTDKLSSLVEEDIKQFKKLSPQTALDYILRITPETSKDIYKSYHDKVLNINNNLLSFIEDNVKNIKEDKEQSALSFILKIKPEYEKNINSRYTQITDRFIEKIELSTSNVNLENIEENILKSFVPEFNRRKFFLPLDVSKKSEQEQDEDKDPEHDLVKVRFDDYSIEHFGKMFRLIFKEFIENIKQINSKAFSDDASATISNNTDSNSGLLSIPFSGISGGGWSKSKSKTRSKSPKPSAKLTTSKPPKPSAKPTTSKPPKPSAKSTTSKPTTSKLPRKTSAATSTAKDALKQAKGVKALKVLGTVGTVATAGIAAYEWNEINKKKENNEISENQATKEKSALAGETAGALGGGLAGAKAGATIGAFGGPVGMLAGTLIGGIAGSVMGGWLGKTAGEKVGEKITEEKKEETPLPPSPVPEAISSKTEDKAPEPEIKTEPLLDKSSPMQIDFNPLLGYLSPAFNEMNKHLLLIENILSKQNNNFETPSNLTTSADNNIEEPYTNEFKNYGGGNGIAEYRSGYKNSLINYI